MDEKSAREVLKIEARAIEDLIPRIGKDFIGAVNLLQSSKVRVVFTGMGKSGIIGKKISATLASTGTPSFFLHPAEGLHGDIGMIARGDSLIAVSNSGETIEIIKILPAIKRLGLPVIGLTGNPKSTLAEICDFILDVSVSKEAGPAGLVPTASTTAALAMGDALAIVLFERRGLKPEDFAFFHPGGMIGRRLLVRVSDLMHTGDAIPVVSHDDSMRHVIIIMTEKKLGMTAVIDPKGNLCGIITDGDLRRLLEKKGDPFKEIASEIMTINPKTISSQMLAAKAVQTMEEHSITCLVVVEEDNKMIGMIHLHDLLKSGVV